MRNSTTEEIYGEILSLIARALLTAGVLNKTTKKIIHSFGLSFRAFLFNILHLLMLESLDIGCDSDRGSLISNSIPVAESIKSTTS